MERNWGSYYEDEIWKGAYLRAIGDAVEQEDYETSTRVGLNQGVMRPFEVLQHMNEQRKAAEDPVEERRWEDAIWDYIDGMDSDPFPDEEEAIINGILDSLDAEAG